MTNVWKRGSSDYKVSREVPVCFFFPPKSLIPLVSSTCLSSGQLAWKDPDRQPLICVPCTMPKGLDSGTYLCSLALQGGTEQRQQRGHILPPNPERSAQRPELWTRPMASTHTP